MSTLSGLSPGEAIRLVLTAVGVDAKEATLEAPPDLVIAEYLRHGICALTVDPESMTCSSAVYVTRLLNRVRRQVHPLWPGLERLRYMTPSRREMDEEGDRQVDPLRRVMEALRDLRDLADLGRGYWLPAPLRFVRLPTGDALAIGGLSTEMVSEAVGIPFAQSSLARWIRESDLPPVLVRETERWQDYSQWLGPVVTDLREWTRRQLQDAERDLQTSGSNLTNFEVYSPGLKSAQLQHFRWLRASELPSVPRGIVLCRSEGGRFGGPIAHWFGRIARHRDVQICEKECRVEPEDVRLIQYGLDLLAGSPTRIEHRRTVGGFEITFKNWLPPGERRLLTALARDLSPRHGRLPGRFAFTSQWSDLIFERLGRLGVRLSES